MKTHCKENEIYCPCVTSFLNIGESLFLKLIVQSVDTQQLRCCRVTDWKFALTGRKCPFD